jgi:CubicO group peptidase (beta-lactamase class C family)
MDKFSLFAVLSLFLSLEVKMTAAATAGESSEPIQKVEAALPPHVGACVLGIDHGKVVFKHGYGVTDVETNTPCTPATNFRLASVSKQFTATAVMLLVDRGKISLDDTLDEFFPGFPNYGRRITVKHLLTHTSGLPHYEELIPKGTTLQLDDLDVLHILMDTKEPRFKPGEKFEYSNSGYTLLGLIVEEAARQPFHDFMLTEVFQPLGMKDSVLYQRGLNEVPHRAFGHERKDGKWIRADQSLTSAVRGDGGVYSSLDDYQKWLAALGATKILLGKESCAAMFKPQVLTDREGSHYGYGWFIDKYRDEPRIHHNGDTQGFRECVQRYPERQAAIFLQLNGNVDDKAYPTTTVGEKLADLLIFDRPR